MTVTVTQTPEILKQRRARIQERCRERGITHDAIALAAACHRTLVVHYFAGRRSAEAVERAISALLNGKRAKAS